jgi:biopolymer transport protein ExbD
MAVSAYSPAARDTSFSDINITPLVDVMLVLLVIFMLAVPAMTRTLPVRLPVPGPDTVPPQRATLLVQATGDFVLNGQVLTAAALEPALDDLVARSPQALLRIDAAADSEYQAFATALAAVQRSGLANVSVGD